MPEGQDRDTPIFVKRCVVDLVDQEGHDLDSAFAICVDNFQDEGYLKDDSMEMTSKGEGLADEHEDREEEDPKLDRYEEILNQREEFRRPQGPTLVERAIRLVDGVCR